jgi:hypothetical protein
VIKTYSEKFLTGDQIKIIYAKAIIVVIR